jgi:hypothetical protein
MIRLDNDYDRLIGARKRWADAPGRYLKSPDWVTLPPTPDPFGSMVFITKLSQWGSASTLLERKAWMVENLTRRFKKRAAEEGHEI